MLFIDWLRTPIWKFLNEILFFVHDHLICDSSKQSLRLYRFGIKSGWICLHSDIQYGWHCPDELWDAETKEYIGCPAPCWYCFLLRPSDDPYKEQWDWDHALTRCAECGGVSAATLKCDADQRIECVPCHFRLHQP